MSIANINPIRYRGYYYDVETGLYYLNTRYYDPETGRFLNADNPAYLDSPPLGVGHNLFAYCGNNPVSFVDHNGNFPWLIAAVVAVVAAAYVISVVKDSEYDDTYYDSVSEANAAWAEEYRGKSADNEYCAILYKETVDGTTKYKFGRTYKGYSNNVIPQFIISYVSGGFSALFSPKTQMVSFIHSHPSGSSDHHSEVDLLLVWLPGIDEVYVVPYERCSGVPEILDTYYGRSHYKRHKIIG